MQILQCQNLCKDYTIGENIVHAIRDISIGFEQGEICAVRGPSGSGKSTLLHMLGGLEYPTSGNVFYQNEDLYAYNDNQLSILRRRRFGFVFQAYNLVQELTAYENILLPVLLDKKKPDKKYLTMLIEILGLEHRLDHLPSALSGGQQQRVAIARALANKPAILFADEPTGNLDGKTGREVLSLLKYASKEMGVTLIMVTHDLHIAEQAERIILLEDGSVTDDSGRREVQQIES
ncbi:MAG TPA: peptide ABC transporter ATP-binding protein [Firmicutes bacterium]|jgi:putative ABC transport system ATP-binding protein|nr:ABC transporter ATP-binding protein [Bacillota bacterium]HAA38364.1 peptide ABC transporter ATP-binding protein [Bacillota bacterium]